MDKIIRLFWLCTIVGAVLMFFATQAWWMTPWYEDFVLGFTLLGLGCVVFHNSEESQEFFAAGLGALVGSFVSYIWLTPFLIKHAL